MEKYAGGVAQYRAAEGKEVLVPYRGPVSGTAEEASAKRTAASVPSAANPTASPWRPGGSSAQSSSSSTR